MNWSDVGRVIAPLAPTLGGILGGLIPFPGASLMGQAIGNVIARQFGVEPTPQAVSDAVKRTEADVAIAKLNAATEEARVKVQGFVEAEKAYHETVRRSIEQTGLTMRAELEHQHWFFTGWRPCAGWLFDVAAAVYLILLTWGTSTVILHWTRTGQVDMAALRIVADAWPAWLSLIGSLALMVGVYVFGRSTEKAAAIEASKPPVTVKK